MRCENVFMLFLRRTIRLVQAMICVSLALSFSACVSYVDLRAPAKGSVENPVECGSPLDQRGYLKRLRGVDLQQRLWYEYLDSVAGPNGVILDRFRVENPAPDERGFGTVFLDLFRSEPEYPPAFRVYMSIYGASPCELEGVPGYEFLGPEVNRDPGNRRGL